MSKTTALCLSTAVAAAALGAAAAPAAAASGEARAITTDGRLVTFALAAPGRTETTKVRGIAGSDRVVGIDERPLTGVLHAVTRGRDGAGKVYAIDPSTGRATLSFALRGATGAPVVLQGRAFGVDFNPVADALRIVSTSGQNLRVLPSDRMAGPAGTTFADGALTAPGVSEAAYTANLAGSFGMAPATTTLFDVDEAQGRLVRQAPPNEGQLVDPKPLALRGARVHGFDIRSDAGADQAYVALSAGSSKGKGRKRTVLRTLDLATGAFGPARAIGTKRRVLDLAVDTPAASPMT